MSFLTSLIVKNRLYKNAQHYAQKKQRRLFTFGASLDQKKEPGLQFKDG